jgi:hypothetical protein
LTDIAIFDDGHEVPGWKAMSKVRIIALFVVGSILIAANLLASSAMKRLENPPSPNPYWTYTDFPPLIIDGDEWFEENGIGFSGAGTSDDPYFIESRSVSEIDPYGNFRNITTAFEISNTSVHLEIRRCSTSFFNCSLRLTNVTNCSLVNIHSTGYEAPNQIVLENCSSCLISNCEILGLNCIQLYNCRDIDIAGNVLYGYSSNLELWNCEGVRVYHNDFLSGYDIFVSDTSGLNNTWDNGYPSGGNFWQGVDFEDRRSGSNQNKMWADGIGDTPYEGNVTDRYPLVRSYSGRERYEAYAEASRRFPMALLADIVLVPAFVLMLPEFGLGRRWTIASLAFASAAVGLSWPMLVRMSMTDYVQFMGISLAELEIMVLVCTGAAVALFVKARDWRARLNLPEFMSMGVVGGIVTLSVSVWSGVWMDLPWMSSGEVFLIHTMVLFIGACALGWYVSARKLMIKTDIIRSRIDVDPLVLLLIFVIISFGLVGSVFGYGLVDAEGGSVAEGRSQSVLLNALPGIALSAFGVVSLRSVRTERRQVLPMAIAGILLVMFVFIYLSIVMYLAWMYST